MEKVLFQHIEGLPGSQYKMRVLYEEVNTEFGLLKQTVCQCSVGQDARKNDIWFEIENKDEQIHLLTWALESQLQINKQDCQQRAGKMQKNEWLPAKVRMEDAYSVISNSDTVEGRGKPVTVGWTDCPIKAEILAKGQGVMGSDATVKKSKVLRVFYVDKQSDEQIDLYVINAATPAEVEISKEEDIKQQALAKLNEEEKKVLGLK